MRYITTVGDIDSSELYLVFGFKNKADRYKAEDIMREHRRDDEEVYDTFNMINALENSDIEYWLFEDISEMWI